MALYQFRTNTNIIFLGALLCRHKLENIRTPRSCLQVAVANQCVMQLCVIHQQHCVMPSSSPAVAYLMCSEHRPLACCVVLCCTVRASWWLSLVVPVWCGGTRRKWVRGNNSVPQASTIVTDYALPPPVSHGSWTTLILEQRFKMSPPARKVVISLGKDKWSESVVFFWFC